MDNSEAKALFNEADDLYRQGRHAEALGLLDQLDATYPNNRHIQFPRARCLAKVGRRDEAVALCDQIAREHDYPPAAELKARIEQQTVAAGPMYEGFSLDDLNTAPVIDDEPSGAFARPPVDVSQRRPVLPLVIAFAVVVGAGIAAFALLRGNGDDTVEAGEVAAAAESPSDTSTAGAGADVYAIDTSGPPELIKVTGSNSQDGLTVNATVEYGIWTSCGDYACFEQKFAACEPAAIRMQAMGEMIMEYRILGEENGVCQLEMTAVNMGAIPMFDSWSGKSMVCPCDNTKDFIKVTEETSPTAMMTGKLQCEGPLADAMQATMAQYQ